MNECFIIEIGPCRFKVSSLKAVRFWSRVAKWLHQSFFCLAFEDWMYAKVEDIRAVANSSKTEAAEDNFLEREVTP